MNETKEQLASQLYDLIVDMDNIGLSLESFTTSLDNFLIGSSKAKVVSTVLLFYENNAKEIVQLIDKYVRFLQ